MKLFDRFVEQIIAGLSERVVEVCAIKISELDLAAGDVVVLKFSQRLPQEVVRRVHEQWALIWRDRAPVRLLILDGQTDLEVLRSTAEPQS